MGLPTQLFLSVSLYAQQTNRVLYAPDPATSLGTKATGRGQSTVASELDHDSLFQNPASAVFKNFYAVSLEFNAVGNSLTASIVDTQSGPVGGGIFYSRKDFQNLDMAKLDSVYGNISRIEEQAGIALMAKISEQFGLGGNVKWSYLKSDEAGIPSGRAWTFDFGARFKASNTVTLGLLGQNLLKDSRGLLARKLSAGIEFTPIVGLDFSGEINSVDPDSLIGAATLPNTASTVGWSLGAQYRMAEGVAFRGGFLQQNAWNRNSYSLGLGYQMKTFSVDYAFQKSLKGEKQMSHLVGFSGYF